ncbi:MAG TPA: hypothetical protein VHX38_17580 [Pseudonocardiaceae bacterium]|jgi:hypothetical protein|nr:hypothetical protein [Pseudonocardiaceae bacterium]
MTQPPVETLPVGHPARRAAAFAVAGSIMSALIFTGFAFASTQLPAVRAGSPWQDDPYVGMVSFTEFLVPTLAALIALRTALWRRDQPLPRYRVEQLLRASLVTVLMIISTVLADWIAVAVRADRPLWNHGTLWLLVALGVLTVLTIGSVALWRRARAHAPWPSARRPDGDWLEDLAILLDLVIAGTVGVDRAPIDLRAAMDFPRRHILAFAVAASLLGGLAMTGAEAIGEGWTSPLLFGTFFLMCAGGFLAFCLICEAVLWIAVPRTEPAAGTPRRALRIALVAGCLGLPAAAVLRAAIWTALGAPEAIDRISGLATVTVGGGLTAGLVAFGVAWALLTVLPKGFPPARAGHPGE